MLNTAWLYTQHSKHVEKAFAAAAFTESSWSNSLMEVATAAVPLLPHALSKVLLDYIGNSIPSHARAEARREEEHNDNGESCDVDESEGTSSSSNKKNKHHSTAAQLEHLVKEKQAQWLQRARQWYASAASVGIVEAQRELGACLAGLGEHTWQRACTKDSATIGAARAAVAASVALARKQVQDADAAHDSAAENEASGAPREPFSLTTAASEATSASGRRRGASSQSQSDADAGSKGEGSASEDAAALLEAAGLVGGDLQALRTLAYWHSGYAPTTPAKAREGSSNRGSSVLGGDRLFSRSLYAQCAALGGYPDGLPCQVEAAAMEVYWLAKDVAALLGWRSSTPSAEWESNE